jgi:hypothetical protein
MEVLLVTAEGESMKTMKISIVAATAACCLALSGVVSVGQERIPELQRGDAASANTPTLSGCVARGASTGTYTLTRELKNEAAPADADKPRIVALTGTDVDLDPHVGHVVSLTGSYLTATEAAGPTGTAGTEKPAALAADASRPLRTLTVKSLKMMAGSCSEGVK